jgi:hypothetical protein
MEQKAASETGKGGKTVERTAAMADGVSLESSNVRDFFEFCANQFSDRRMT